MSLPHSIPVALWFTAEFLIDCLHVVKQVRASVEKAGFVFNGDLETQPQWRSTVTRV